jgi:DNA-binding response OmpR family regulator
LIQENTIKKTKMIEDNLEEQTTSSSYDVSRKSIRNQNTMAENLRGTKSILVVDDEYDITLTLKIVLEDNGFKVDSFNSPLKALESFEPGRYDLAIIDLKMPTMNGFVFRERVSKADGKVKICLLTAVSDIYYEGPELEGFAKLDERFIIRKPIDNESLIERIKSIINDRIS